MSSVVPKIDYSVLNKTVDNAFADFDMNSIAEKPLFTDAIWDIQILSKLWVIALNGLKNCEAPSSI